MPLKTKERLKILTVLHSPGYGGAEIHALALMKAFRKRGHDVCYAGRADSWLGLQCEQAGIRVKHLRMRGLLDVVSLFKFTRFLREWRPDVVHAHLSRASQYTAIATRLCGAGIPRVVATVHTTNPNDRMRPFKNVIAVSGAVKTSLVARGYNESTIHMIYNGVADPYGSREALGAKRAEARNALGIPGGRFALVCAGRFMHDKGQDVLVDAMKHCGGDTHLYLAGDNTTPFGRGLAAACESDPRIHLLGFRDDVQQILPAFDCYVAPSRREAISLSLLEASAAGLPIIATNVGGIPEVVDDGQSGILTPSGDSQKMAGAIRWLAEKDGVAAHFGMRSRQRYEQFFTETEMIDRTLALYRGAPYSAPAATATNALEQNKSESAKRIAT